MEYSWALLIQVGRNRYPPRTRRDTGDPGNGQTPQDPQNWSRRGTPNQSVLATSTQQRQAQEKRSGNGKSDHSSRKTHRGSMFEDLEVTVDTGSTFTAVPRELLRRLGVPVDCVHSQSETGRRKQRLQWK